MSRLDSDELPQLPGNGHPGNGNELYIHLERNILSMPPFWRRMRSSGTTAGQRPALTALGLRRMQQSRPMPFRGFTRQACCLPLPCCCPVLLMINQVPLAWCLRTGRVGCEGSRGVCRLCSLPQRHSCRDDKALCPR